MNAICVPVPEAAHLSKLRVLDINDRMSVRGGSARGSPNQRFPIPVGLFGEDPVQQDPSRGGTHVGSTSGGDDSVSGAGSGDEFFVDGGLSARATISASRSAIRRSRSSAACW